MRFCTNCGARLPENGKFCVECGQRVPEFVQQERPAAEPVAEVPVQPVPPVQQPYVPPVQQEYAPPVQQPYVPPVQQEYAPPVQQPYVPPVQQNFAPVKPVKKKPFDKRLLIPIILVPVLLLVGAAILLFSLLGGQNKVDEELLGVYYAVSCDVDGYVMEPEEEWIELEAKGKATLQLMDEEYECKWSLDGEDLTVKYDGDTFEGTLEDGVIELDFEDMFYVFEKDGLEKDDDDEDKKAQVEQTDPVEEELSPVGCWVLIEVRSDDGETMTGEELQDAVGQYYIQLNDDGTGIIVGDGDEEEVTWTDTEIIDSTDVAVTYELQDGQMTVKFDGIEMVLIPGEPSSEPVDTPEVGYQSEPGTYTAYYGYSDGTELYEEDLAEEGGVYVTFYGDGTGMISLAGEIFDMTYDAEYIYCDGMQMEYYRYDGDLDLYVDDSTWFYMSDEVASIEEEDDAVLESLNGDWYGWWVISDVFEGDSEIKGNWWDACASLYMNWDGTAELILWDEDTSWGEPLGTVMLEVNVTDNGVVQFISTEGDFMGDPVEYGEWIFYSNDTEYTDALGFYGNYADDEVSIEFYFLLRPWGTLWDDIEQINPDDMPYYYYDWYLPMLEDGWEDAPASMELP